MAVILLTRILCLFVTVLPLTVWGQTATSIIEIRESEESPGTNHAGHIVSFTDVGSGAGTDRPRPWVCYTAPTTSDATNVEWQRPDGTTILNGIIPAAEDRIVTRVVGGPRPGIFLYRGTNYLSPDGDYCCVLTVGGTESERRCVTFISSGDCPPLTDTPYPNRQVTYNDDTNVLTYGCANGYRTTSGDQQRTCENGNTWTGSAPTVTCTISIVLRTVTCPSLTNPANGLVVIGTSTSSSTATYTCNNGYVVVPSNIRVCGADGKWTGDEVTCCEPVDCGPLSSPTNGMVNTSSGTTLMNTSTYSCNTGYRLVGNKSRICQCNGEWTGSEPFCQPINCGHLTITNGMVNTSSGTTFMNTATYRCDTGYRLVGIMTRTCEAIGEWSNSAPTCKAKAICPNIISPNGMIVYNPPDPPRMEGTTATHTCNTGYRPSSEEIRLCQSNGEWNITDRICNAIDCGALTAPTNGIVNTSSGTTFMNTATYSCDTGYRLVGDKTRTCQSNGNWSSTAPTCDHTFTGSGCLSGTDTGWNIQWQNTGPGTTATQPCPGDLGSVTGQATRYCDVNGEWSSVNVLNCQQVEFAEIYIQALETFNANDTEVLINNTVVLTEQLAVITEPTSMSPLPSSLNTTNTLISRVLDVLENNTAIAAANEFIIDVLDNILDENNTLGWTELQEAQTGAGSQVLLENIERFAELFATSQNNTDFGEPVRISRPNIAVSAMLFKSSSPMSVNNLRFPVSDDLLNFTNSSTVSAEIEIPAELITKRLIQLNGVLPVTFILLQNLETFLPSSTSDLTNSSSASIIISSQVGPRGSEGQSVVLENNPISINFTFNAVPNPNDSLCVFWNFSDPVGNGGWESEGVRTVESTTDCGEQITTVRCTSTHLTSFAVLVAVTGGLGNVSSPDGLALQWASYIGCGVSIPCLLVTVIFFLAQGKQLFSSVHYFVHLNLALSLLLGYVVFVSCVDTAVGSKEGCVFVAALLHYSFLSAFCWMLCEGVMLYLLLVAVFSRVTMKWWFFLLLGYVTPLPFVVITLAVRSEYYGVRDLNGQLQYCWLSTKEGTIYGFVAPMLLIIVINVIFLVLALRVVWSSQKKKFLRVHENKSESEINLRVAKSVLFSSLILLPLLGLTWVFGIFSFNSKTRVFAWIFTILNSLQGVAIFVFHVMRHEKVKTKLGRLCFAFRRISKRHKLPEPVISSSCGVSKYERTDKGMDTLKSSVDTDTRIKEDFASDQVSYTVSETKVGFAAESAIDDVLVSEPEEETKSLTNETAPIENVSSKDLKQDV